VQIGFREDALGKTVAHGREAKHTADIERQVAQAVAESEQRLDGGEYAISTGGRQAFERRGEGLQVGKGYFGKRLPCPAAKSLNISPIGALGMGRPAVQPEFDELVVGGSQGAQYLNLSAHGAIIP
jgi:hypothetical protein